MFLTEIEAKINNHCILQELKNHSTIELEEGIFILVYHYDVHIPIRTTNASTKSSITWF